MSQCVVRCVVPDVSVESSGATHSTKQCHIFKFRNNTRLKFPWRSVAIHQTVKSCSEQYSLWISSLRIFFQSPLSFSHLGRVIPLSTLFSNTPTYNKIISNSDDGMSCLNSLMWQTSCIVRIWLRFLLKNAVSNCLMGLILCFRSNSENEGRSASPHVISYYINCINFKTLDGGKESVNLISLDTHSLLQQQCACM
jgi:hypothetical protein